MPYLETTDGTRLAYEDYGTGAPIVFLAGWSLNAEMWEYQVPFFVEQTRPRGTACTSRTPSSSTTTCSSS